MTKRSLSFQQSLFSEVEAEAARAGLTPSAAMAEAAKLWLIHRQGLRAVSQWEHDYGTLTASELAQADQRLDDTGVVA